MPLYQIKDWDAHFENDRSRNRIQCSFVCVPNKQHGMGFCRIMAEPDGAAIYGVWHCIVGACSQQRKRNGWLTPDGDKAVSGWGVEDLALKFRRPENEIARALEVLCSEKVGWIIDHENTTSHRQVTAKSPLGHVEGRKEGRKEGSGCGGQNFIPLLADALKWLADWRKNGADYTEAETKSAFLALSANGWMWGKNPVTDHRAALERQIQTDRTHQNYGKDTTRNNSKNSSDRNAGNLNSKRVGQYDGMGKVL
jgi:hypothetical protein